MTITLLGLLVLVITWAIHAEASIIRHKKAIDHLAARIRNLEDWAEKVELVRKG